MNVTTYSFLDVSATLVGPGGALSLGAGAGPSDEGITIESSVDFNTMAIGADGSGMHSLSGDKSGRVTLRLLKTSPLNKALMSMVNFQRTSGATHGQNTLSIRDLNRGDEIICRQVAFKKVPNISFGKEAGNNEWTFDAVYIDHLLG